MSLAVPASSSAAVLWPHQKKTFTGVTDTGKNQHFWDFTRLIRKHPALLHTFHYWGTSTDKAISRWAATQTRGVLSIGTTKGYLSPELITPREIALGKGDDYLIQLNDQFGRNSIRVYLRPLGEPNNWHNPYSVYNSDGSARDEHHTHYWYIKAWRRMAIIVRDGGSLAYVNRRLAAERLPPVQERAKQDVPGAFYRAPVAFIWSPIVYGSPRIRGNAPGRYWPGSAFVDWIATDFYSKYPAWRALNTYYRKWKRKGKPMAISEWAVWDADDYRFVRKLFRWQRRHKRVRMLLYFREFSTDNPWSLTRYPKSARVVRNHLRRKRFASYALEYLQPPSGGAPAPAP